VEHLHSVIPGMRSGDKPVGFRIADQLKRLVREGSFSSLTISVNTICR
jgi:hypothetical protein